jgi:hypothetical protein
MSDFEQPTPDFVEPTTEVLEADLPANLRPDYVNRNPNVLSPSDICLNPDKYIYKYICKKAEHFQSMMGIDHDVAMLMAASEIQRADLVEDNILNIKIENDALAEAVKQCKVFVPYDTTGEIVPQVEIHEEIPLEATVEDLDEK